MPVINEINQIKSKKPGYATQWTISGREDSNRMLSLKRTWVRGGLLKNVPV